MSRSRRAPRIVSLLPSATELVCALGLGDCLVGVTHECDWPAEVRGRPVVTRSDFDSSSLTGHAIEALVRGSVHQHRSLYHLDDAMLRELRPDLILTQELCEVCAPSYARVLRAARELPAEPRVVSLEPRSLADALSHLHLVAQLAGAPERAEAVVRALEARIGRVATAVAANGVRPRVAVLEWADPIYCCGHWMPGMVRLAGGEEGLGEYGRPSGVVSWEQVRAYAPEVMVVAPCGFGLARSTQEARLLQALPGFQDLPAVAGSRFYAADGSAYFNRPGPRLVATLELLAGLIHPDLWTDPPAPGALERVEVG